MQIFYTGIGCNKSHLHTETEFLEIMRIEFTHKDWTHDMRKLFNYQLEYKDWVLPEEFIFFTLDDWLDYSGGYKIEH